jgi:hypothetical protein
MLVDYFTMLIYIRNRSNDHLGQHDPSEQLAASAWPVSKEFNAPIDK